jgi:hypothetical protein
MGNHSARSAPFFRPGGRLRRVTFFHVARRSTSTKARVAALPLKRCGRVVPNPFRPADITDIYGAVVSL